MKIMAICGSGLGSSFMVEMNIKKILKKLEIEADVEHSDLSSATPGAADLFVMAKDIAASASVPENQLVVINNIIDINDTNGVLHQQQPRSESDTGFRFSSCSSRRFRRPYTRVESGCWLMSALSRVTSVSSWA